MADSGNGNGNGTWSREQERWRGEISAEMNQVKREVTQCAINNQRTHERIDELIEEVVRPLAISLAEARTTMKVWTTAVGLITGVVSALASIIFQLLTHH